MKNKCVDCIFYDHYHNMGCSTPLCSLERDLLKAVKRYDENKEKACKYHRTLNYFCEKYEKNDDKF